MQSTKVRSRLKAQPTKVGSELIASLSKPLGGFADEMLFSIRASQDVKLSNVARSVGEAISLIQTGGRLSSSS